MFSKETSTLYSDKACKQVLMLYLILEDFKAVWEGEGGEGGEREVFWSWAVTL